MKEFEHRLAAEVESRVRQENKIAKTQGANEESSVDPQSIASPTPTLSSTTNVSQSMPSVPLQAAPGPPHLSSPSAPTTTGSKRKIEAEQAIDKHRNTTQASTSTITNNSTSSTGTTTNQAQGTKRSAEESNLDQDDNMAAWLYELSRIPDEMKKTVMIFESDGGENCNLDGGEISIDHVQEDLMEIFSPPRVVTVAKKHGLNANHSIDRLTTRSSGEKWDLRRRDHQLEVRHMVETLKPQVLIGSPPCSWFSQIMRINWAKISRQRRRSMLKEARCYLKFMCELYQLQYDGGRVFVHEHPFQATSWD